jgi:hypothetical protein
MKILATFFYLLFMITASHADTIHHFDLKTRTADEIIPILQPLLQQNESISGKGFLLFIQTSSQRATELKKLIESIDQRGKTLRISVTSDETLVAQENQIKADVQVNSGDARVIVGQPGKNQDSNITISGNYATQNTENSKTQFINLEEGASAFVAKETLRFFPVNTFIGNGRGISEIQSTQVNVRSDGFYVEARTIDEQSAIIKVQSFASGELNNGRFEDEQLSANTTLRAAIGQWVELGGIGESSATTSSGILSRTRRNEDRFNRIFLKVEVVN